MVLFCFLWASLLLRETQIVSPSKLTNQLSVKDEAGVEIDFFKKSVTACEALSTWKEISGMGNKHFPLKYIKLKSRFFSF